MSRVLVGTDVGDDPSRENYVSKLADALSGMLRGTRLRVKYAVTSRSEWVNKARELYRKKVYGELTRKYADVKTLGLISIRVVHKQLGEKTCSIYIYVVKVAEQGGSTIYLAYAVTYGVGVPVLVHSTYLTGNPYIDAEAVADLAEELVRRAM